jgi:predicted metal-dependent peptidase
MIEPELERMVSRWILSVRRDSPFFATLAMFCKFFPSSEIGTAATDGKDIFFNPQFMGKLSKEEQIGVVIHELLHAALLHVPRRGERDPTIWNIAADIVVNGQVLAAGYALPKGHIREKSLEQLTVEEVYHKIEKRVIWTDVPLDLLEGPPSDCPHVGKTVWVVGNLGDRRKRDLERHWKDALEQAATVQRLSNGTFPAGLERLMQGVVSPQLDWRSELWRYLVRTPCDFQGFDRRLIGRGLYLEALEGESVNVYICVDTSGSIADHEMATFLGEVRGILGAYPMLRGQLYYADAALYGPYDLDSSDPIPRPVGGGGTDFRPFFAALEQQHSSFEANVCVYLTDGYGTFPQHIPEIPTLWVVQAGGMDTMQFPFGSVTTLLK